MKNLIITLLVALMLSMTACAHKQGYSTYKFRKF